MSDSQNSRVVNPYTGSTSGQMKAPPLISGTGIVRAVSDQWIEIYGLNLASHVDQPSAAAFSSDQPPASLGGTKVNIGGQTAFISYISPNQVNARIPASVGAGPQSVTVTTSAGTSEPHIIITDVQ